MATIKRDDLLKLGFEDSEGPVLATNLDYIVVRFYIHRDKPWIGVEEHYPKKGSTHINPKHILSAAINYGTKEGTIVYNKDEVNAFLAHQGKLPFKFKR
ncbi:hypothetical protein H8S90_20025 [Olivibacter sp. SDN3]|uniref:hypothetical protein n=1 Tax=Olivibacter sp. SDN3 TaxID=2764720 RepID=UPI00165149AA|nr:hypothetical protein [Olivibacter sp. SDN3]QNL49015.1 hypothetical protein H8S90_20025 [Olivibacter sp. SDN3]